jgi:hypothetical protein
VDALQDRRLLSASALGYAAYLNTAGSFLNNNLYAIAVNAAGNAFVAGQAAGNGFLTELNAAGTGAVYSTTVGAGVHTFTYAVILRKRGTQTLTVADTANSSLTTTDSISVV